MISAVDVIGVDQIVVIATRNPGKLREFRRLVDVKTWRIVGMDEYPGPTIDDLIEPGATYADNAAAKAEAVSAITGEWALADDSGIEVVALDGWPGLHSARWMGAGTTDAERVAGLLDVVVKHCPTARRVRYVSALALVRPGFPTIFGHGECWGQLVKPQGSGGFGYDPAFFVAELGDTFGRIAPETKDRVSHRGRAWRDLQSKLYGNVR